MAIEKKLDESVTFNGDKIEIPFDVLKTGKYLEVSAQIRTEENTGKKYLDIEGKLPHSKAYIEIEKIFDQVDDVDSKNDEELLVKIAEKAVEMKNLLEKEVKNLYWDERNNMRMKIGCVFENYYRLIKDKLDYEYVEKVEKKILGGKEMDDFFELFTEVTSQRVNKIRYDGRHIPLDD